MRLGRLCILFFGCFLCFIDIDFGERTENNRKRKGSRIDKCCKTHNVDISCKHKVFDQD